jgi:hypothetical protein
LKVLTSALARKAQVGSNLARPHNSPRRKPLQDGESGRVGQRSKDNGSLLPHTPSMYLRKASS